jgi:hypothetical protein
MNSINHLNNSATIAELADLSGNVTLAIETAAITDAYLAKENQALKALSVQMLKGMATARGKVLKEEVDAADIRRDDLLLALTSFLDGFIKWKNEATAPAANLLLSVINTQGNGITRLSLEKESASLDAILKAYEKAEMVQALATTNLTGLANELREAQKAFINVYQQSAEVESTKTSDDVPSSIRRETIVKVNEVMDYIGTMAKANPTVFSGLSAKLTEMVTSLNQKIRTRNAPKKAAEAVKTQTT